MATYNAEDAGPRVEALALFRLYEHGTLSADEIFRCVVVAPRLQQIMRETAEGNLHVERRLAIRSELLKLIQARIDRRRRVIGRHSGRRTLRRGSR